MPGTWHFYADDYRFTALWGAPYRVPNTQCAAVIEPNFSTAPDQPAAVALWGTYRKRWLARWWQECGVDVWADLNVAPQHAEVNLLGLPPGWGAFACRAWRYGLLDIDIAVQRALEHCQPTDPRVLLYGGGRDAARLAEHRGWLWAPEQSDEARGRAAPASVRGAD